MTKTLLSLLVLTFVGVSVAAQNAWKPVKDASVAVDVDSSTSATVIRVISKWTNASGSDSVRVEVHFSTQPSQYKQYPPTRTADTSAFNAVAGVGATGSSIITAVKANKILTPVKVDFVVNIPMATWPGVTGATVTTDTL